MNCKSELNELSFDKDVVIETKIDSLMTLEEKIGQTVLYSSGRDITGPVLDKNYIDYIKGNYI